MRRRVVRTMLERASKQLFRSHRVALSQQHAVIEIGFFIRRIDFQRSGEARCRLVSFAQVMKSKAAQTVGHRMLLVLERRARKHLGVVVFAGIEGDECETDVREDRRPIGLNGSLVRQFGLYWMTELLFETRQSKERVRRRLDSAQLPPRLER